MQTELEFLSSLLAEPSVEKNKRIKNMLIERVHHLRWGTHDTDSENCWCHPRVEIEPNTGNKIIIHNRMN
jgi:hypothetical protein